MHDYNAPAPYLSDEEAQYLDALHEKYMAKMNRDQSYLKTFNHTKPAANNEALEHARNTTLAEKLICSLYGLHQGDFDIYLDLLLGRTTETDYQLWRDLGESDSYIYSNTVEHLHDYLFDGYDLNPDHTELNISHKARRLFIDYTPSMSLTDYFAINIAIALRY